MPHSFGLEFLDYASRRPEFAGWEIRIEEDNGLIVSVNAMRRADR